MSTIQLYNWNIASKLQPRKEFSKLNISKNLSDNVMIAYGLDQLSREKYCLFFNLYYVTIIRTDNLELVENTEDIIYSFESNANIASYNSQTESFTTIYSTSKINISCETFFSGQTQYDTFFNITKINPSCVLDLNKLLVEYK